MCCLLLDSRSTAQMPTPQPHLETVGSSWIYSCGRAGNFVSLCENMELVIHQGYSSELHLSFRFLSQSAIHSDQAPFVTLSPQLLTGAIGSIMDKELAHQSQELSSTSPVPLALRTVRLQKAHSSKFACWPKSPCPVCFQHFLSSPIRPEGCIYTVKHT